MRPLLAGIGASLLLLTFYFGTLTLLSGWPFAVNQFLTFRYFVLALATGFGLQVGLYRYLRTKMDSARGPAQGIVVASGTTSTAAMLACCSHYLINFLPFLGAAGLITLVAQYQREFFWLALTFNAAGILYLLRQIRSFKHKP